ncbi:methyltransferase, FkbM family [alpha proteobacterium HIMB59]|nr:methyltransferase, FkbM family [alpha proteobacterium HIMB59]
MNFRFFFSKIISLIPFFPFKISIIRRIYNPDKIFHGKYKNVEKIIKINQAKFLCNTSSYIEWGMIFFKGHEIALLRFFQNLIKSNNFNLFLDIGANIGYFSLPISYKIETLSFEPFPNNFEKLNINCSINNSNIKTYNFGLSNKNKREKIFFSNNSPNLGNISLSPDKYFNLDKFKIINLKIFDDYFDYFGQNILIKIDTEGHELNVLKGMKKILKNNNCFIYIECISEETVTFFKKINYNYFFIKDDLYNVITLSDNFNGHVIASNYSFHNSLMNFAGTPK